jgi:hypothetical protein
MYDSAHHVHSRVSMLTLYGVRERDGVGGVYGPRNISCMPRCQFIAMNMYLQ